MWSTLLTLNPIVLEDNCVDSLHDELWLYVDQELQPQHGVLQHHGVQGHHGGPHVPLQSWVEAILPYHDL